MCNSKFWCNQEFQVQHQKSVLRDLQIKSLILHKICPQPGHSAAESTLSTHGVPFGFACEAEPPVSVNVCRESQRTAPPPSIIQQPNTWSTCPAWERPSPLLKVLGAGSQPSLVPAITVKWRSLSWEKLQENSGIPRNMPPQQTLKILLIPVLSDENPFSDESIQLIFTAGMTAWLLWCDLLLEGQHLTLSSDSGILPSPLTTYRLGDCNSVHLLLKLGSDWTHSKPALSISCAPQQRWFSYCTVCLQSCLAVKSK